MSRKIFAVILIFLLAACKTQPTAHSAPTPFTGVPRPVIIDTDMAGDDWMAILYLLQRADVKIKAITVAGDGEAHCQPGIKNALGLAALAGQPGIPVACGRQTPLVGDRTFPVDWRTKADSLSGLTLPDNPNPPSAKSAVELIKSLVEVSPDKVTILTLGPLTNLAEVLEAAPGLKSKIEMIYIMGGAVNVSGNVGISGAGIDNQTAEWNIYIDPHAARIVFQSAVPTTLIPLDATNQVPVDTDFFNRFKDNHNTPEATFVYDWLNQNQFFIHSGGYYFWDPLAAAVLADNKLATFETDTITVVENDGPNYGRTQVDKSGAIIRVAVNADDKFFKEVFMDTLNAPDDK